MRRSWPDQQKDELTKFTIGSQESLPAIVLGPSRPNVTSTASDGGSGGFASCGQHTDFSWNDFAGEGACGDG